MIGRCMIDSIDALDGLPCIIMNEQVANRLTVEWRMTFEEHLAVYE
jgi:hypothetical protein